jgi:hypothetical protein
MLDGFDLLGGAFLGPRGPGKDASPGEQLAAGIVQLFFPALIFCLVAFAGLWRHGTVAVVLTLCLALVGYVITRILSGRVWFAFVNAAVGLLWGLVALGGAFLLAGIADFYKTF